MRSVVHSQPKGPYLLVVEDDLAVRRATTRLIHRAARGLGVVEVATAREARDAAGASLIGALVDVGLPDDSGLALLPDLKRAAPHAHLMIVTANHEAAVTNEATLLGAAVVRKPDTAGNVVRFVHQVVAAHLDAGAMLTVRVREHAIDVLSRSARLTRQCRRIVELLAEGVRREDLASALRVKESTVRTHVRELLTRAGVDRVDRVAWRLLRIVDDLQAAQPQLADGGCLPLGDEEETPS
ncbi:MAG TPA: response regulator [Kofleriaceae bacterium]|jgi:DNA-binding NarL/FixJ family response regulator|nr:response regulator [Kofleriaceae bacterium]